MTLAIILSLIAIYIGSTLVGVWFEWAAHSDKYKQYRIRTPEVNRITTKDRLLLSPFSTFCSLAFIAILLYFFGDRWVHHEGATALTIFGETVGVLLVYDFFYYWAHRTMHIPAIMKRIHAVHHKARFPTTADSLFVSPIENIIGLGTLFLTLAIFSPVSVTSFLLIIFVHTFSNIMVHSNMVLPHPAFKLLNFWAIQHDVHHGVNLRQNYCNIFPYWDMLFGTYRKEVAHNE